MNCPHCTAINLSEAHRCVRCGRRFPGHAQSAHDFRSMRVVTTATAPDYSYLLAELDQPKPEPVVVAHPEAPRVSYQRSLFGEQVIQMPRPAGMEPAAASRRRRSSSSAADASRRPRRYVQASTRQQSFEFELMDEEVLKAHQKEYPTVAQDGIYCDAPVAQPVHRLLASALDSSMILIALGVFLLTFYLCGGTVVLNNTTAVLYAGIYAVLWFFYTALFGICGADTPGMRWMGLELVNFEGTRPDREQRIYRMFGRVLGILSAGLGLVWSLVDEDQLTWHDHISKTFPSPTLLRT